MRYDFNYMKCADGQILESESRLGVARGLGENVIGSDC